MIHRAPFGSMERFIAILLEHSRKFPTWLMPEQAIILSLSENMKYMKKVLDLLENNEIRALVDNRNETIGKKIRDAEMQNPVYADCRRGRREKRYHFYPSSRTGRKGNQRYD
jgi:threonyl-tRNA synthetase